MAVGGAFPTSGAFKLKIKPAPKAVSEVSSGADGGKANKEASTRTDGGVAGEEFAQETVSEEVSRAREQAGTNSIELILALQKVHKLPLVPDAASGTNTDGMQEEEGDLKLISANFDAWEKIVKSACNESDAMNEGLKVDGIPKETIEKLWGEACEQFRAQRDREENLEYVQKKMLEERRLAIQQASEMATQELYKRRRKDDEAREIEENKLRESREKERADRRLLAQQVNEDEGEGMDVGIDYDDDMVGF